jgi:PAS domain S-box-containing protein
VVGSSPSVSEFLAGDSCLLIDNAARSVYVDGAEVALTPTEFDVLACLAQRAGTVVSTPDLIQAVWGEWFGPVDHVFVHVHHIRRKLGTCGKLIVTKRKAGYLLRVERRETPVPLPWPQITREYASLLQEDARSRESIWLLVDKDRIVTWVSDSITAHLGWSPADLIGKHPWVIAVAEEAEKLERAFPAQGGSPFVSLNARVRHVDGHLVDLRLVANVIIGADGRRLGGVGEWSIIRPDDPPAADGARGRHTMPFRLHYDGDDVLTGVEPHEPFLGWDPDEVIGTHFSLSGLDHPTKRTLIADLVREGSEHVLGRTPVQCSDGAHVVVDFHLRLIFTEGVLAGYTCEAWLMR